MRTAPRPESVGESPEVHLVAGIEDLNDRPLDNLVFQRGDPQRPLTPIRLRDVRPPTWQRPVTPRLHPDMQILKIRLQTPPIVRPRHPVHPGAALGRIAQYA